ncbi:CheR family methyltransferase [Undibacterium macrobrachii]|uniref:Chemotaxis protein methyltransferase n=1 Tax=Undibacterium macrobrachii TaxID=1119058 RepID=A0ABQ2XGL7_9BURK|nr:CheR family methyltransferase [Undibacterium macrobrachii]GGX16503.1 chemotaxis protein methyltransferase [Undibacterium macrobrachii]
MNNKSIPYAAPVALKKNEFEWISRFLYERTGIALNDGKQALVMGRLDKRLRKRDLLSYSDYFALLGRPGYEDETTVAIDLLTTNETYFFREPKHFDFLKNVAFPQYQRQKQIRIWSAASSSGEEAYTIAMTLAEYFQGSDWEVIGTDISTRMLEKAQRGLYPMLAADKIPKPLLKKYCLKGRDEFEDFFLFDSSIRQRVHFSIANLIEPLPELGMFEVIFLRNVMIYFDKDTKKRLVEKITTKLRTGGYFIVSHSESLNGLDSPLKLIAPSIYQKTF